MKKFFKTAGWIALYLGVYFIFQIVYVFVAAIVMSIKIVVQEPDLTPDLIAEKTEPMIMGQLPMSIIVSSIVAFGVYYLISKGRKQDFFQTCQFRKISLKSALSFVPAGVGLVFINGFLLGILNKTELLDNAFSKHVELMGQLLGGNTVVVFLSVAIAAPFIEEIIFRGLILKELRKSMSLKWAIFIQALLFGLYHMQLVQGIYTFFMGILLGLVCVWLKSIWPAIILHLFNNLTSMLLSRTDALDGVLDTLSIPLVMISGLVVAGVTYHTYKNRLEEEEIEEAVADITSL
ncbi:CPBP family intramembrane glutamic endopeptidase [Alkaliphilus transvaalensis]|uniref:CPBP family intramembrane glutamic endopeptidase n=1 Tax=Alkaliphilus transvaalensis TaxID=114628 RepID=UPI0004791B24|nr:CPBP family intramembrane glutamic endopeptidase [Alkaliphilus transvaalensis]